MPKRKEPAKQNSRAPDAKWFSERARELGTSISQLSLKIGGHKDLFNRALDEKRQFKPAELAKLAQALRVPISVLFQRLGLEVANATTSVVGRVNRFSRVVKPPVGPPLVVTSPSDLLYELVALLVEAPSSALSSWDGHLLFYEPALGVRADAFGRLSVIETGELETPVCGTLGKGGVGAVRITLLGGQEEFDTTQVKTASPIRWIRAS